MAWALKFVVSVGLLSWLLLRSDLGQVVASIQRLSPATVAIVLAVVATEIGVASLKWWIFVPRQRFLRIVQLTLIGIFYSIVLPGQVAGEAVKAYRLGAGRSDAEEVAASVVVDKVNGLIGLLVLGIFGAFSSNLAMPKSALATFSVALVAGLVGLYSLRLPALRRSFESISHSVSKRWPVWDAAATRIALFFAAWIRFSARPWLMLASILLGMLFHLLAITVMALIAPSCGIDIPATEWLWIFAVVSLAVLLPLSVGGLGIREGAFVAVLSLMKVPPESALALSLTIFATQLLAAMLGGFVELTGVLERRRLPRTVE